MKRKILVTGGGTAGHILPVLQVVALLKKRHQLNVLYIGGEGNSEMQLVPKNIPFKTIPVGKFRRYISFHNVRDSVRATQGVLAARKILTEYKPDLIFAKGGYVTLPVILAGAQLKIPIVMHESDSVLGLANRVGSRFATKICLGFPLRYYPPKIRSKAIYTGIPIREGIFDEPMIQDRQLFSIKRNLPVLLVTGSSQGTEIFNKTIALLLPSLLQRVQIIHLTGTTAEKEFSDLKKKLPASIRSHYHPYGFIKKGMESVLRVTDLALSRSGSTIAELAAAGIPMILVPLPSAAGDHQTKNAEIFAKEGAAITLRQHYLTPERLLRTITTLLDDKYRMKMMAKQAQRLSKPDAADEVVRVIEDVLRHD